ncbi:MAG: HPr family phosphocarrier protein [Lachnospiraceae bacterium]|jgi:phosphotransferase system HPr (HPr) family protein|nr:HPr family phosphocarrier protein [Lachnospiraceae bacterium]MCR5702027.1 HPr family phosphocarrier protein [Lachnospiraceae bacterium]
MVSETVNVNLSQDAEARPVAVLVQKASQFESRVFIESGDKKINAKSIMGMMSLGLNQDEEITVTAEGDDEAEALKDIVAYIKNAE